ncbi:MAG: phosphoribosylglycinamide formyltransferase, phosphoribosylglycinamide formyltransferase 1 [Candidatus Peregrinibacteria bacterium GW2011_GWF2_38_29]|nr:MAG: phosphoribosylglycinamide formyltransferase, phosphoribosylglycinamide formyltransferase 1 [Candidatus Peregrinibacteria bacterium GW2011_GWF2_38_29]HBB02489.1 phosphoribosylglycinamide formyltransferase [Candidatus Peregrinibacteria bacterium]
MFKFGVLASTKGTDLQAIIDEMKNGNMPGIELAVVVSNKADAYALERAKSQGFNTVFIDPKGLTREQYDEKLGEVLKENGVELVCLIGYMKILTPVFVKAFLGKIVNVHPALIPKFSGKNFFGANVHEAVLAAHETETGCTFHFVTEEVDGGPIILQKKVAVDSSDTPDSLKEKVQTLEKKYYPEIIRQFAAGKFSLENARIQAE